MFRSAVRVGVSERNLHSNQLAKIIYSALTSEGDASTSPSFASGRETLHHPRGPTEDTASCRVDTGRSLHEGDTRAAPVWVLAGCCPGAGATGGASREAEDVQRVGGQ